MFYSLYMAVGTASGSIGADVAALVRFSNSARASARVSGASISSIAAQASTLAALMRPLWPRLVPPQLTFCQECPGGAEGEGDAVYLTAGVCQLTSPTSVLPATKPAEWYSGMMKPAQRICKAVSALCYLSGDVGVHTRRNTGRCADVVGLAQGLGEGLLLGAVLGQADLVEDAVEQPFKRVVRHELGGAVDKLAVKARLGHERGALGNLVHAGEELHAVPHLVGAHHVQHAGLALHDVGRDAAASMMA